MNELLTQIILAARRRDGKSWMNILFVVVLAVFWAIAAIVKAKKSKLKEQDKEQLTRKPGFKPSDKAGVAKPRAFEKALYEQVQRPPGRIPYRKESQPQIQPPQREKILRPQSAIQKLVDKAEQIIRAQMIEPVEESKLPLPTPQVEPVPKKPPEFTPKAVKKLEDKYVGVAGETPQAKHLAEILLDYADPDDLKRAILHYEILGRPLSLRGPSERIIGL